MMNSHQWFRFVCGLQVLLTAWAHGGFHSAKDVISLTEGSPLSGLWRSTPAAKGFSTGPVLYFPANDGVHGGQIWRSDGTGDGTWPLTDSLKLTDFSPLPFRHTGSLPFFAPDNNIRQGRLIVCDGTAAGSGYVPLGGDVSAILAGASSALAFFLRADSLEPPYALWTTNPSGTVVTRIAGHVAAAAEGLALDRQFFVRQFPGQPFSLWASDGTADGTTTLKEFPAGTPEPSNWQFLPAPTGIYFIPTLAETGAELWHSNGTVEGTGLLKDINPGTGSANAWLSAAGLSGGRLFFSVSIPSGRFLWRSDGTAEGTIPLQFLDDPESQNTGTVSDLQEMDGKLYYMWTAYAAAFPYRLCSSDGTPAGTVVLDGPSAAIATSDYPPRLMTGDGKIILGSTHQTEIRLWRTDGTTSGTSQILAKPSQYFAAEKLGMAGSSLLFQFGTDGTGTELWRTDGTVAGTAMVRDINPVKITGRQADWNGRVYFWRDGIIQEKTDGTPGVATPVAEWERNIVRGPHTEFLGAEYYVQSAYPEPGYELRRNRGSAATDERVTLLPGVYGFYSYPVSMVTAGNLLFFELADDSRMKSLWRSDGTAAGTYALTSPAFHFSGFEATACGGILYTTTRKNFETVLQRSDGTAAGTFSLTEGMPAAMRRVSRSVGTSGSFVYFISESAAAYPLGGLWRTDGTPGGTLLLREGLTINSYYGDVSGLTTDRLPGHLFFAADDGTGLELWGSDGTPAGTAAITNIFPGGSAKVKLLAAWDGRIFFAATDPVHGRELWFTDGTAAGTHLVEDREPGVASSYPDWAAVTGGKLFVTYGTGAGSTNPLRQIFSAAPALQPLAPESSATGVELRVSLTADGTHGEIFHEYGTDSQMGQRTVSQPTGGAGNMLISSQEIPLPAPSGVLFHRSVLLIGTQRLEGGIQRLTLTGGVPDQLPPWLPCRLHSFRDEAVSIRADRLPAYAPDPDGDITTVSAALSDSREGGTVQLNQGIIFYQPPAGFTGSDSFEVQATQSGGVSFTFPVEVVVVDTGSLPHRLLPAAPPAAIRSQVLPGRWYRMERFSDAAAWLRIGEVRADATGSFLWQNEALAGGRAFFRAVLIP